MRDNWALCYKGIESMSKDKDDNSYQQEVTKAFNKGHFTCFDALEDAIQTLIKANNQLRFVLLGTINKKKVANNEIR